MSQLSLIAWTDFTWNFLHGCTPVSEGCKLCFAPPHVRRMSFNPNPKIAARMQGLVDENGRWTGEVHFAEDVLEAALHWPKRRPARVFVNSLSDVFHEAVSDDVVARMIAVMRQCPNFTFQVLTKRPERMREMMTRLGHVERAAGRPWPLPNLHLGTSVENQRVAGRLWPLLHTEAALHFVSAEPLLAALDMTRIPVGKAGGEGEDRPREFDALRGEVFDDEGRGDGWDLKTKLPAALGWVIVGGESGKAGAVRTCDLDDVRRVVTDAARAAVPCFVKQLGSRPAQQCGVKVMGGVPTPLTFADHKGGKPEEWPEDLRVRQFPSVPFALLAA